MRSLLLALCYFLKLINGGEIFDVTTIYDVGACKKQSQSENSYVGIPSARSFRRECPNGLEGHIHARTNALGLSYHNRQNQSVDRNALPLSNIICDFKEVGCDWNIIGWDVIPLTDSMLIQGGAYTTNKQILFLKRPNPDAILYVTIGSKSIETAKMLFLISFNTYYGPKIYEKCDGYRRDYQFIVYDRNTVRSHIFCDEYSAMLQLDYGSDYLVFHTQKDKLQLYRDLARQKLIQEWAVPVEDCNNIFFSISDFHFDKVSAVTPALQSQKDSLTKITSPLFSPDNTNLCLAIVVKAEDSKSYAVLDIFAEDVYHINHHLYTISDIKSNFEVRHVNILLRNNIPSPIKIVVQSLSSVPVTIARISSCSPEGEEVEILPNYSPPQDLSYFDYRDFPVYSASLLGSGIEINDNISCLNSGVPTTNGCACRPGFVGEDCEIGCGKNRFGHDCSGLCSLHDEECSGLLLCTNLTDCHCAPGLSGRYCTDKCDPGTYGNDCQERCGHCLSNEPCDIYTGECTSCEPGYYPPYCKKVFVYFSSKPVLTSNNYGTLSVTFDPYTNVKGYGDPELYQIQYREKGSQWLVHSTKSLTLNEKLPGLTDKTISEDITSLKDGAVYEARILLMDTNFNIYDGDLVTVARIVTKCDIPEYYDYKVTSSSNTTSFLLSWSYVNETMHSCPLEGYEISWKDGWKWFTNFTKEDHVSITNFLPGSKIKFKVRAKTTGGFAPYSKIVETVTKPHGSSSVRDLQIVSTQSSSVSLSWNPPRGSESRQLQYTVTYKCLKQPACYPGCNNATEAVLTQDQSSVTLSPLLPFAQYLVTVTPQDGTKSGIYVGTSKTAPVEIPKLSTQPPLRTNTSITVFWDEVPVCSSFLQGYNYQLTKKEENLKILSSGFTKDTKVSFQNLTASTDYVVKIFIVTVAGWNAENSLSVDVSTSATVPEAVQDLEIYKRGRNMLGLRWAEPRVLYGQLKSFTVKYSLGNNVTTETIAPTHCIPWPELYCHTIEGLKSSRRYNITVSAKNAEVEENGEESLVSGITKESLPTAPENLKELNTSSTSVALQWGHPILTNRVLRSFLISVEETEKYDQDSCCQVYPLVETSVSEEVQHYDAEVSGLHPAATYFVSVSAKTVGLGPSQSLITHTRPPHLPFTVVPQTELGLTWLPQQQLPEANNSEIYTSLIRAHFLIAVFNDSSLPSDFSGSGILDSKLESVLEQTVNKPFIFVSEYNTDELLELNLDTVENESSWGQPPSSYQSLGDHQLVAVQLTEYSGVYNVDLRYSIE